MAAIQVILLNGTIADANEVMANFNEIYTNITNINVASNAAIAFSKLAALPSAQILVGSAGNVPTAVAMSGDATISNTGVVNVVGITSGLFDDGTALAPSISFKLDTDTGAYRVGANVIGVTAGGVKQLEINPTFAIFKSDLIIDSTNKFYLDGGTDTYFQENSPNVLWAVVGSVKQLEITTALSLFKADLGIDPTQKFYLDGGINTYLQEVSADKIAMVTGASSALSMDTTSVTVETSRTLYIQDGAAATPSFAFAADTNSGVYRGAADTYIFVANGNDQLQIEDGVVTIPVTTYLNVTNNNDPPNTTGEVTPRSLCKGWVKYTLANPTPTVHNSYNVTSVTYNSNLSATVTWDNAFTSANYACVASLSGSNANAPEVEVINYATTSIDITENGDGYLGEIASVAAFGVL